MTRRGGDLVCIGNGPLAGRWYWAADWDAACAASAYMRDRMGALWEPDHPSLICLSYKATDRWAEHPQPALKLGLGVV